VGKRDNVEGSSLFSILPKGRDERLLRLLVAYQVMWDFLDSVSEREAHDSQANGRQLHRALVEALDPEAPLSDYYRYHPSKDDGGYLLALVGTCRRVCAELPSYRQVRSLMLAGVAGCAIQSANHEPEPNRRNTALRDWAKGAGEGRGGERDGEPRREPGREPGREPELAWFELAAATGAFMPHVLLALAAEPECEQRDLLRVHAVYFPWVSLAISMLDSYVDQTVDKVSEDHSYLSYYTSETQADERLAEIIRRIAVQGRSLPNGRRHAVLIDGIVATYLSTDAVNRPELRARTRMLARAGGPLTRLLLPFAHGWRATRARWGTAGRGRDLPPGPPLPDALQTYLIWRWPHAYMERCQSRYGRCFTHRMTNFPRLVLLSDPDEVKAMLTAPADVLYPGEGGETIVPIVGTGSFMLLDGEEHMSGRKAVLPALHKRVIHAQSDAVAEVVQRAVASWPRDASFPLHPRLRTLTLEVILRRVFALHGPGAEDRLRTLRERVLAMLSITGSVVFPVPALRHGPGRIVWRRFLRQRSDADELIYELIDERRREDGDGGEDGEDRADALSALLEARDGEGAELSRTHLRDNVMSLAIAGHETTASQLAWAFQLLAHNPKVQERLIEEIDADSGDEYLTATIDEVLRHRPVFLFTIPRAVKRPIEIGRWTYSPPVHLLGCTYLLHHDPEVYPAPHEFRPERFLDGQPSPHTWMPWGSGRRRCPGMSLAMLEMKTVLRTVLSSVTVCPASRRIERPRWRSVIVTPHAGSRVVLRRRKRRGASGRGAGSPGAGGGRRSGPGAEDICLIRSVTPGDLEASNMHCPQNF
jgi:cytochrome P450